MAVSISDISQYLDLSVSTVSKALNGYSDVAAATRQRVLAAADELGYHPSAAARNLRRRRTEKIGLLLSFPVEAISEYVARLITGAMSAAEEVGYNLILYPRQEGFLEQLTRICRGREVDGLLLLTRVGMEQTAATLAEEKMPYVVVGRRVEQPQVSFLSPDDRAGARTVVRHLISLGHSRIGYTTRPQLGITSRDRLDGYRDALEEADLPFDPALIVPTAIEPHSAYWATQQLLDLPNPPTAIFAIHDLVAVDCLQAVRDRNLRVPEDVAIVGFDDWSFSQATRPPLTTVRTPLAEMGERALAALFQMIAQPETAPVRQTLPTELLIRQSTTGAGT